MGLKEQIITCAKEAAAGIKQAGVKALDKAVSAIGAKKTLEAMQKNLSGSITEIRQSIEKVEAVGKELRSVGGHLKNAGRAAAGKEMVTVDGGTEGRFQAAVLAPLRSRRHWQRGTSGTGGGENTAGNGCRFRWQGREGSSERDRRPGRTGTAAR